MSNKQHKKIRKETQLVNRQVTEVINETMERLIAAPWKVRWRLALKILIGKKKVNYIMATGDKNALNLKTTDRRYNIKETK